MSDRTNEQLEAEITNLRFQVAKLQRDIEIIQIDEFMKSNTVVVQKAIAFSLAFLIVSHAILGYFGKQGPLNGISLWCFAFLAAVILVGYLSQIARMLQRNFSIRTELSRAGAQLDPAVKPNQTTKKFARKS